MADPSTNQKINDLMNDPSVQGIITNITQNNYDPATIGGLFNTLVEDDNFNQLIDKVADLMGPNKDINVLFDNLSNYFPNTSSGITDKEGKEASFKEVLEFQSEMAQQFVNEDVATEEIGLKFAEALHAKYNI